ncbi:small acid-soluble spore protein Tlp [Paenibacillus selenitireducens]|jgi:small acid-soluble spore protein (thioredoxin-like protein)|uniref:Small acid-soluble spore protein Tlp n=1 Tax=Paenibacillus selenitireducens TaxID=1324314 RepID=A0A1T2X2E0_9BACL|nr:small acid-soluble spore protein Tlp [Paenibacillus selenitireducens]OPA74034.1 small acid-soluble spore protein Tlp [Paenibacillus selenitireducens]
MAKPDDRSDNAKKIKNAIENTRHNIQETNAYLDEHAEEISSTEVNNLQQKNTKRKRAIEGFEEEYHDET